MLQQFLTFDAILVAIAIVVGGGIWAYRTFSKQSAELKLRRLIFVQDVTVAAWHAVEGFASGTDATWDDNAAKALKKVAETIAAQTGKPLTPGEAATVALKLDALNGAKLSGAMLPSPTPLVPVVPR